METLGFSDFVFFWVVGGLIGAAITFLLEGRKIEFTLEELAQFIGFSLFLGPSTFCFIPLHFIECFSK